MILAICGISSALAANSSTDVVLFFGFVSIAGVLVNIHHAIERITVTTDNRDEPEIKEADDRVITPRG